MNIEDLKTMSNQEINNLCAEKVMRWEKYDDMYGETGAFLWVNNDGDTMKYVHEDGINEDWNPTSDMNDALLLLDKLPHYEHYYNAHGHQFIYKTQEFNQHVLNKSFCLSACYISLLSFALAPSID